MKRRATCCTHLDLVRDTRSTPVAVIVGGDDGQRQRDALDGGRVLADALAALDHEPHLVHAGASLIPELQASGAQIAAVSVLDDRLADGTLQQLCGDMDITCIGASADALRSCADKALAGARMASHRVAVPPQRLFTTAALAAAGIGAGLPRATRALGERIVVKPRYGSGGRGVKRVYARRAAAAITSAFNYESAVVVERFIEGQEFTVLMTGTGTEPMAVGIARVDYASDAPNAPAWARRFVPGNNLPPKLRRTAVATGRRAVCALGLAGLTTVDLIIDGDGTAWVIDVDCMLDWRPEGPVAACVACDDLTEAQLLASLLRDMSTTPHLAA